MVMMLPSVRVCADRCLLYVWFLRRLMSYFKCDSSFLWVGGLRGFVVGERVCGWSR